MTKGTGKGSKYCLSCRGKSKVDQYNCAQLLIMPTMLYNLDSVRALLTTLSSPSLAVSFVSRTFVRAKASPLFIELKAFVIAL